MLPGILIGAASVIAVLLLVQVGQLANSKNRYLLGFAAVGVVIATAVVTVVISVGEDESSNWSGSHTVGGVSVTDLARVSSSLSGPIEAGSSEPSRIASVPSLISGLEQRLESSPNDASGWALLAQSYAFIGSDQDAERALARAVDLGQSETDLRSRVANARRNPHEGVPGAPALN